MHLDDEQFQRLLHGEIEEAETVVLDHLDECLACRMRVAEAKEEEAWVQNRLRQLDHVQPVVRVETILASGRRRAPAWGRWAAGIGIALAAAGAAYAAPGSPVPAAIARIMHLIRPASEHEVTIPLSRSGESQAGIAVEPGPQMAIVFVGGLASDTATISLSDSAEVTVRALGGITTFSSDAERLTVHHQGAPAKFELLIPRSAPLVEVRIGDRRVLLKTGPKIVTRARPDRNGIYRLPLAETPPQP